MNHFAVLFALKVETAGIIERMLSLIVQINRNLAGDVAEGQGLTIPAKPDEPLNMNVPADVDSRRPNPLATRAASAQEEPRGDASLLRSWRELDDSPAPAQQIDD